MSTPLTPTVDDVRKRFREIPPKVRGSRFFGSTKKYLAARNTIIPWDHYVSAGPFMNLTEHFQGATRVGRKLVLSGGIDSGERRSQLIVIDMGTRTERGAWALPQYGHDYRRPPPGDVTLRVIDVAREDRWHAGGIQAVEGIVAVPAYGEADKSDVFFHDIAGGASRRTVPKLEVKGRKARAVGVARLPRERYGGLLMLTVWDDHVLSFHRSRCTQIERGFREGRPGIPKADLPRGFAPDFLSGTYQCVNLVVECSGDVYLIAARNAEKAAAKLQGDDLLDLYRLHWPGNDLDRNPRVEHVGSKQIYCYNQQCNFAAAVGIHVDGPQSMWLYAAAHWLHEGNTRFNFNEYSY